MPTFRRLSAEEIAELQPRRRGSVDLSEYRQFLENLAPGEGGEVALSTTERRQTVKRRLTAAAQSLGKQLRYRRSPADIVQFEILDRVAGG
jgi:hypothetical protein